ncbi:MAG: hypothetical protein IKS37_00250 [Solobacterium sp.]|nr:hypothetical protein [Solobacterium sp.]
MLKKNNIYHFSLKAFVAFAMLISNIMTVHASVKESKYIESVILTYGGVQKDVWNDIFTVDNGTDAEMHLKFNFDDSIKDNFLIIRVISENEYGVEKLLKEVRGYGVSEVSGINSIDLPGDSGIRVTVSDVNISYADTMLGIFVKKNEAKELFESADIKIGPKEQVTIDMSSFSKGMGLNINLIKLPITFKHYTDGRSVVGIGWNSTEQAFWEGAAKGQFKTLSHGQLTKKWKDEYGENERGSFGLCWTVGGYAVSYDDNPNKMSGQLQFYVGTGGEQAGQYAIFTYSITLTIGMQGTFTYTIEPAAEDPFQAELEALFLAGLELYGGIGLGCLFSVGIYGLATFGSDFHVLPEFYTKEVYIDGELGFKAKFLGRTVLTFKIASGRTDFYKRDENGKEIWSAPDTPDLEQRINNQIESMIANDYGSQVFEINEAHGETIWHIDALKDTSENNTLLYAGEEQMLGDRKFSKILAENINPENGIQIKKLYDNNSALILLVGHNDSRESGNKGELMYSIYDHNAQTISEPQPVMTDMNADGTEDAGGDFNPRLVRGAGYNSIFATWLRGTQAQSANLSLREAVSDLQLCFAKYDAAENKWTDFSIVSESNAYILGGAAVGFVNYDDPVPYVFAYTNPEDDPAGLSEDSAHQILMYRYSAEDNTWTGEVIDETVGRIARFDAGQYYFGEPEAMKPAAAYSLEKDGAKTVHVVSDKGCSRTFENAWNGAFTNSQDEIFLTFMKDAALYFANGYRNDYAHKVFPVSDEEEMTEATYSLIGDLYGSSVIGYLKSQGTSQNLEGYARVSSSSSDYGRTEITDVAENTNVNYFDGVFIGNDDPVIVFSTQEYSASANGDFVDGVSNLYIQAGSENMHVSLTSADLVNSRDLDGQVQAEISTEFRNNGLIPIDYVDVYARKVGTSEFISLGRQKIEKLLPGDTEVITVTLPDTFTEDSDYTIALAGGSDKYPAEKIQTEIPVDLSDGMAVISSTFYNYRYAERLNDSYLVEIKGYGAKPRSGKVVFYNSETLEVYKEESFSGVKLGNTVTVEFGKLGRLLHSACPNLAVRILENDEVLDDERPAEQYRPLKTIPQWFYELMPIFGDEETPPAPTPEPTPAPTPAPETPVPSENLDNNDRRSADTGDESGSLMYAGILTISGLAVYLLLAGKRKRSEL